MRNTFLDDFFLFPDTIFYDFLKRPNPTSGFPVYDIFNEDGKTVLEYALAGYEPDQISVTVEGTKLCVAAIRPNGKHPPGRRIVDKTFNHSFEAKGLDLENVQVSFIHGVLRIEVPSIEPPKPEIKKLEIKTDKKLLK